MISDKQKIGGVIVHVTTRVKLRHTTKLWLRQVFSCVVNAPTNTDDGNNKTCQPKHAWHKGAKQWPGTGVASVVFAKPHVPLDRGTQQLATVRNSSKGVPENVGWNPIAR